MRIFLIICSVLLLGKYLVEGSLKFEPSTLSALSPAKCTFKEAQECLRGRNILIMGTSVSRHWHFALQRVLSRENGTALPDELFVDFFSIMDLKKWYTGYRENEKVLCGSDSENSRKGESKQCMYLEKETDTLMAFHWLAPFTAVLPSKQGKPTETSLRQDGIATAAFLDTLHTFKRDLSNSAVLVNGGLELAMLVQNQHMDEDMLRQEESEITDRFQQIIDSLFKPIFEINGNICWRLSTQLCCQHYVGDPLPYRGHAHRQYWTDEAPCLNMHLTNITQVQLHLARTNAQIVNLIKKNNGESGRVHNIDVFDSWALTDHSKCDRYEDFVHAPLLSFEQIEAWMVGNLKCKCGQDTK